jgi:hypothetical protein
MVLFALLLATFIICAVSALPTKWYVGLGAWVTNGRQNRQVRGIERELARRNAVTPFAGQTSFLSRGVGLALDVSQRLVFVAVREGGTWRSAILPFSAVLDVHAGEMRDSGFYDYYIDLTTTDGPKPVWRISCGENPELAQEIRQTLTQLHA